MKKQTKTDVKSVNDIPTNFLIRMKNNLMTIANSNEKIMNVLHENDLLNVIDLNEATVKISNIIEQRLNSKYVIHDLFSDENISANILSYVCMTSSSFENDYMDLIRFLKLDLKYSHVSNNLTTLDCDVYKNNYGGSEDGVFNLYIHDLFIDFQKNVNMFYVHSDILKKRKLEILKVANVNSNFMDMYRSSVRGMLINLKSFNNLHKYEKALLETGITLHSLEYLELYNMDILKELIEKKIKFPSMKNIKFGIQISSSTKRKNTKELIDTLKIFLSRCRTPLRSEPLTLDMSHLQSPYKEIIWMRNELKKIHVRVICHEDVIKKERKYKKK